MPRPRSAFSIDLGSADLPRFAANLTMLFNELPFLDRFERAAKAGFEAVEFLFPYAFPAAEIQARLKANAIALGVPQLDCLAGGAPIGVADATLRQTFVGTLRPAAAALEGAGIRLLVEPINTFDIPGFYLNRTGRGRDQLPAPVRSSRPHRVQRPGWLRVQARDEHRSGPGLAGRAAPQVMARRRLPPNDINEESTT